MITYLKGDATQPQRKDNNTKVIIPHICNDLGLWGAGFVLALSKRWKQPEQDYRSLSDYKLGRVLLTDCGDNIIVANMIAQHGVKPKFHPAGLSRIDQPIRYNSLRECLNSVNLLAVSIGAEIHAPKFGAGLAGGDWLTIEKIINEEITVPMYVYEFQS